MAEKTSPHMRVGIRGSKWCAHGLAQVLLFLVLKAQETHTLIGFWAPTFYAQRRAARSHGIQRVLNLHQFA